MPDYIPSNDDACDDFLGNMAVKAAANAVALGLTTTETSQLSNLAGLFNSDLADRKVAEIAAEAATAKAGTSRKNAVSFARVIAQKIQANPAVPDELRTELGLPIRDKSKSTPSVPAVAPTIETVKIGGAEIVLRAINPQTGRVAKPDGVKFVKVFEKVVAHNEAAPSGIDQMSFVDLATSGGKIVRTFGSGELCKTAYYAFQYVNSQGEAGPVSTIIPASIAA